jgi:hypothetical protein
MDDIESIEAQISYLQEDIGQRLQLLNDDQSTVQFKQSTSKPVNSETVRSDWHTTGLHNWGHDIIIISYFGK